MIKVIRDEDLAAMDSFEVLLDKYIMQLITLEEFEDGIDALKLVGKLKK